MECAASKSVMKGNMYDQKIRTEIGGATVTVPNFYALKCVLREHYPEYYATRKEDEELKKPPQNPVEQ